MEMNWTPSQKNAIEARGVSLAVSAAAGSGKTAVLTHRILSLLSEENGIDAAKLVVVTFTKAAAKEVEERLYQGLSELVEKGGENKKILSRKLLRLSLAQISTIHSFAFSLVKEYRKELDLGETIRIADDTESAILMKKAVEETLTEFFGEEKDEKAKEDLYRLFGNGRKDGLADVLMRLLNSASSYLGGLDRIEKKLSERKEELNRLEKGFPFKETLFGKEILSHAKRRLREAELILEEMIRVTETLPTLGEKYPPFFREVQSGLRKAADHLEEENLLLAGKTLEDVFSSNMPTIRTCPPEERSTKEACQALYGDKVKKTPLRLSQDLLSFSRKEIIEEGRECLFLSEKLVRLAQRAKSTFDREKREKGVVDYADLEHLCLALLTEEKDGVYTKSPLAEKIGKQFDAVFVDEYQDTNAIQDTIFRAIARNGNLFVVGDPKQSIYRFRGAEPEIFARYKSHLPLYPAKEGEMQKILLSDNFRCDRSIIDLVNSLFRNIMDEEDPDSLYRPEDRLRYGKKKEEGENAFPAELVLVAKDPSEETEENGLTKEENREAAYLAGRIGALLSGEEEKAPGVPFVPSDIAVICRTHLQIAHVRKSLEARGIPCVSEMPDGIREEPEYLFVHSLLSALDNPTRDVPLLGALLSPVFRFTSDGLYRIRRQTPKQSFYTALSEYAEKGDHAQTRELSREALILFARLRDLSHSVSLPAFVFHLYHLLGIDALFGCEKGENRVKEILLDAAESAAGAGIHSLGAFCRYLEESPLSAPAEEKGVRLLTIHKSKGLEMPVVFVSFLAKAFSTQDERAGLIVSPELGAFVSVPRLDGRAKMDPLLRKSAKLRLHREGLEEGKRVLYVALTRAKNKLILTAAPEKESNFYSDCLLFSPFSLPRELQNLLMEDVTSPLAMLLLALRENEALKRVMEGENEVGDESFLVRRATAEPFAVWKESVEDHTPHSPEEVFKMLQGLNFRYEKQYLENLPKKLSVSEILRENREEEAMEFYPRRLLDFEKGILASGAEKIGTATHQVMQYASFSQMAQNPEKEWRRLEEKGFLSPEDMALVEKDKVEAFFVSPLYERMKRAGNVVHEQRFNVFLPAKTLGLGEEGEVLIQGVVDAWFENPDGTLTLLDFKTDRVKGKDGEEILRSRHGAQLRLYAAAVRELTGKEVSNLYLYSFALGKEIKVE